MTVGVLVKWLEERAPLRYQESYDNSGLLVGDSEMRITGVICALDTNEEVLREAVARGCNVVLSHHPIIFKGLKRLTGSTVAERTVAFALRNDIALYAGHTNWDSISGGVSFSLARRLKIINPKVMMPRSNELLQLVVYVPTDFALQVTEAAFSAGAGKLGNYDECHFTSEGTGTFRPLEGSNPFSGTNGIREVAREQRLEFVVPSVLKSRVRDAVWLAHPYEEVAHSWISLDNSWSDLGYGAVGDLSEPVRLGDFIARAAKHLGADSVRYSTADLNRMVRRIAVCGGSGAEFISAAAATGADVYVTGDAKYHGFQDTPSGIVLVDVGHYESEQPFIEDWAEAIRSEFVTFAVLISGSDNRPVRTYLNHG
jgi:dinuclear metal center YbgI/SA1388 family protein